MFDIADVIRAGKNFDRSIVLKTPLEKNESLCKQHQSNVWIKREDQQIVRSYKIRGAYNFLSSLTSQEAKKGVVAASAGNHAQGVALACQKLGIKGTIFMPLVTPSQKVRKTQKFGGENIQIELVGDNFSQALTASQEYCQKHGSIFVHPYDDLRTIVGQTTVGIEIYEQMVDTYIDYLLVPIGGGGLISGISTVFKELSPQTKIIGVQSQGAPSMYESIKAKKPITLQKVDSFADGVAVSCPGKITFEIVSSNSNIDEIIVVPNGLIAEKMLATLDDQGIILEPAGALTISALSLLGETIIDKNVVCVASGGNFDFERLVDVKERALKFRGLKRYFVVNFPQRPGALKEFLNILGPKDDIVLFEYTKKTIKEKGPALVGIETNDPENFDYLLEKMQECKIHFEDITENEIFFNLLV